MTWLNFLLILIGLTCAFPPKCHCHYRSDQSDPGYAKGHGTKKINHVDVEDVIEERTDSDGEEEGEENVSDAGDDENKSEISGMQDGDGNAESQDETSQDETSQDGTDSEDPGAKSSKKSQHSRVSDNGDISKGSEKGGKNKKKIDKHEDHDKYSTEPQYKGRNTYPRKSRRHHKKAEKAYRKARYRFKKAYKQLKKAHKQLKKLWKHHLKQMDEDWEDL